jgi:hypothetical protein
MHVKGGMLGKPMQKLLFSVVKKFVPMGLGF